jgi:hypothetical protein
MCGGNVGSILLSQSVVNNALMTLKRAKEDGEDLIAGHSCRTALLREDIVLAKKYNSSLIRDHFNDKLNVFVNM